MMTRTIFSNTAANDFSESDFIKHKCDGVGSFFSMPSSAFDKMYLFKNQGGEVYHISKSVDLKALCKEDLVYSLKAQFRERKTFLAHALQTQSEINWIQFETSNQLQVEVKYRGYYLPATVFDLSKRKLLNEELLIGKMEVIDTWIAQTFDTSK